MVPGIARRGINHDRGTGERPRIWCGVR